jgi:hypothetical protein
MKTNPQITFKPRHVDTAEDKLDRSIFNLQLRVIREYEKLSMNERQQRFKDELAEFVNSLPGGLS